MKTTKPVKLSSSMAEIAARSPSESLSPESRYVILADLRMGDGGKKDELSPSRKALFAILGRWYLPRGYTLVLDGDIEDLRRFWLKDILAAWPEMYALFDAFAEQGRLRKILGDRDLALLRLASYPYSLSHGLRLDGPSASILVLHGHQASLPYLGRDYLSDYIQRWLGGTRRRRDEEPEEDRSERFKAERRLYRATSRLGILTVEGHTRRPLFESRTKRGYARDELDRILGGEPETVSPGLFSPGRVLGARGLRMLELEGDRLSLVRWVRTASGKGGLASEERRLRGSPWSCVEMRSSSLADLFARVGILAEESMDARKGDEQ